MNFKDFKTAKEFLEQVLKLKVLEQQAEDEGKVYPPFKCYGIYSGKELVNFAYNQNQVIEHAQYELDTCIKLIRETTNKFDLFFYIDLLNFVREKGELIII